MERTVFKMILLSSVWVVLGKPVYVNVSRRWTKAQEYCREHFTDLYPVSSDRDEERLRNVATEQLVAKAWIGLYREPGNITGWRWSGGVYASYLNWGNEQPNNIGGDQYYASACWLGCKGWNDYSRNHLKPFFCLNLIVVKERRTWEEAWLYCRQHHTNLSSLESETKFLLAQREIQGAQISGHVWTGLRYLGDRWLWVNGDPLEYQAWPRGGGQHQCPAWSHRCGAVTTEGQWQYRDCQENLNFICE